MQSSRHGDLAPQTKLQVPKWIMKHYKSVKSRPKINASIKARGINSFSLHKYSIRSGDKKR